MTDAATESTRPASTLVLPLPRWPFLWPLLVVPVYAVNGTMHLVRVWHGSLGQRLLGVGLLLAWILIGFSVGVGAMASTWRELRLEEGCLLLRPSLASIPRWLRWSWDPSTAEAFRKGVLEVPLAHASLEWVGKTLLLHGHPERDVRLGRGARAEQVAAWLKAQGLPDPVGR